MKRYKIILGILCLTALVLVLSLRYLPRRIKPTPAIKTEKEAVVDISKRKPVPSRPEDFGMVVTHGDVSEEEIQRMIAEKVKEAKSSLSLADKEKLKEVTKEDPEKTREKMAKINASIQECEETLANDPHNQAVKERLQRLRTLKAIANELPKSY